MTLWLCETCAVERADEPTPLDVCPICSDERQYLPPGGQRWTTLEALRQSHRLVLAEPEPGLVSLTADPKVGIGQTAMLVVTEKGCVLWDPPGLITDDACAAVRSHGPLLAVAASHPHMFGVQVEWAEALDAPVLVIRDDARWLQGPSSRVTLWSGTHQLTDGLTLHQLGGHFRGSSVLHWAGGADGRGTVLAGDTIFVNPDGTAAFMRSYPNRIPLSGAVAVRVAEAVNQLPYDRLYNNFGATIATDAPRVVSFSAQRHAAWARGDYDHLT